jgi:hypothetical protein
MSWGFPEFDPSDLGEVTVDTAMITTRSGRPLRSPYLDYVGGIGEENLDDINLQPSGPAATCRELASERGSRCPSGVFLHVPKAIGQAGHHVQRKGGCLVY